jgi:hypothetical protein
VLCAASLLSAPPPFLDEYAWNVRPALFYRHVADQSASIDSSMIVYPTHTQHYHLPPQKVTVLVKQQIKLM